MKGVGILLRLVPGLTMAFLGADETKIKKE
jgi:hypothetical protein